MSVILIVAVLTLLAGLFMVIFFKGKESDKGDFLYISGYWLLFFSIAVIVYNFLHFNPKYFIWIGFLAGLIISFINFGVWDKVAEQFSRDKYSGGGLTYNFFGCFGLIALPLFGLGAGLLTKIILG
jgi:hypothetical protein